MHAAKTNFSKLAEQVEAGEDIIIARGGKPVMRLIRYVPEKPKIIFGLLEGQTRPLTDEEWAESDAEIRAMFKEW